jgi:polysaccharide pyruvyl transferase WcaK-like protein
MDKSISSLRSDLGQADERPRNAGFGRAGAVKARTVMPRVAKRIGLLDHMGGGNLGDDSTQTAVMSNIRRRWPDAIMVGFSMNPADTEARHAIPAYPIRRRTWDNPDQAPAESAGLTGNVAERPGQRLIAKFIGAITTVMVRKPQVVFAELMFLVRSLRIMRSLDIFVISGGGQLLDSWGGTWDYPFTIFKWVALAKLSGTKCYFVNVGAGPLQRPLSRYFIKRALALADYVSFRDHKSYALTQQIGFKGKAQVFPDCVYGLDPPSIDMTRHEARNLPIVGMSPMAYCDPRRYWLQDQNAYEAFVRKLVVFGTWLSQRCRVALFSTDIWFDSQTLDKVGEALSDEPEFDAGHMLAREPVTSLETLLSHMSSMDFIITCRFHGVVFAHLMNIPVIALSHHPKVTTLMADLGLSEYCLDIDTFDPEQLKTAFARISADKAGIKARMAGKLTFYRGELTRQFDQLFSPETVT